MRLVVSPEARLEFEAAERYYNQQLPGLGNLGRSRFPLNAGISAVWS